jgi:hypothetical protein
MVKVRGLAARGIVDYLKVTALGYDEIFTDQKVRTGVSSPFFRAI